MNIYHLFNFIIGSCVASHAAVVNEHFQNREAFIFRRSRCASCHQELALLDEIPLVSYLFLHGRCRYCHELIPAELFLFELIGGFAYLPLHLNKISGNLTAYLLFFLLMTAISDSQEQSFPTIFLLPIFCIELVHLPKIISFQWTVWLFEFLPILACLLFCVARQKLGKGDLWWYLILAIYFTPEIANQTFLFACLLILSQLALEKDKSIFATRFAFIPYLLIGLTISSLLN